MVSPNHRLVQAAAKSGLELPLEVDDSLFQAAVSTALVSVFRGKFCDAILPNRKTATFKKEEVIYDVGDKERTFFFLQDGFVISSRSSSNCFCSTLLLSRLWTRRAVSSVCARAVTNCVAVKTSQAISVSTACQLLITTNCRPSTVLVATVPSDYCFVAYIPSPVLPSSSCTGGHQLC